MGYSDVNKMLIKSSSILKKYCTFAKNLKPINMRKLLPLIALLFAGSFISAQTIIFQDDFEAYTAGQTVASQTTSWTTWSGGTTGSEAALVSTAQAHSGTKSMNVIPNNDMVYSFGNKTSGEYQIDFYYYVATGSQAYFNIEHTFGVQWAMSCEFANGTMTLNKGNVQTTFTYTPDTWMLFTIDVDLANDDIDLNLDGTELESWQFSYTETTTTGLNKLGCINFYGPAGNNYFVDDFVFTEISSGLLPPTISINTSPITVTNLQTTHTLPFSNTGQEVMDFNAYPVFIDPSVAGTLVDGAMAYDQGGASAIGWGTSFEVYAAVRFLPALTYTCVGQNITSAVIFINDLPIGNTIDVFVWDKAGFITPGTTNILAQKTVTATAASDNVIVFDTPIPVTGEEIWIGYRFMAPGSGFYTLGTDDAAIVPNTSYYKAGPVWGEFDGVGGSGTGNFCIRAIVEGAGWPTWLSVGPASGTVAASGSQNLTLNFNSAGLPIGTYEADVVVGCSDPAHEWTEVHVTLDVTTSIDNNAKIGVMTYPNPATDFINVVSDEMLQNVTVYTMDGKVVSTTNPESTSVSVNISDLASGNYILEVKAGNNSTKRNIVVK